VKSVRNNTVKTLDGLEFFSLLKTVGGDLLDFSIGFVKSFSDAKHEVFGLAGSGTLVEAAGIHAILTAGHVLSELPDNGPLGLITPTRINRPYHKMVINMELTRREVFYHGDESPEGPDLGLLILPLPIASELKRRKIFYNLGKRREVMSKQPPPLDIGGWILNGIIDEQTENLAPDKDTKQMMAFHGFTRPGVITSIRDTEMFDYLSLKLVYDDGQTPPKSLAGCSGGGLWHAIVEECNGSFEISELLLAGVPFYETRIANDRMIIECHGRRSIYKAVVEKLEEIASRS
jgi:hypothetical protein